MNFYSGNKQNTMKSLKRFLCFLVAIFTLCCVLATVATANIFDDNHSGIVSPETNFKNYEIAVAYDNSGSMYYNGNAAWYQAKYAMEIFASMIDFNNGDKLTIFPMHPVTIDGNTNSQTVQNLEITNIGDIDKIHNMYTPSDGSTPFDTVINAYNYLSSAKAANTLLECWLIVLTDGSFDEGNCQTELMQMSQNVKVQYIPFGSGSTKYDDVSNTDDFYACDKITSEKELQKELIGACNRIFQRDTLDGYLNGQTLTLDLSMKKVIVFAQGEGTENAPLIDSLKSDSGVEVKKLIDSGKRKYSENNGSPQGTQPSISQTGQVVTFDACAKGKYTLDCNNATDIQIFYEPDVAMVIDFIDQDGNVEDFSDGEIKEGEYTFNVKIVDAQTGEDVSDHKLLGGNVTIDSKIKYTDSNKTFDLKDGDKVTFTPGEDVTFDISATYLDKYELKSLDAIDIDWSRIDIIPRLESLNLVATVEQTHSWYQLSENNNWKPIRLDLTISGAPLTDEQLDNATVSLQFKDDKQTLPYQLEILHGQSAINIHIGRDDAGNYVEPKTDTYNPTITVSTIDKYGNTVSAEDNVKFDVSEASYCSHIFWIIIIVLVAIALLAFVFGFPARPKHIYISHSGEGPFSFRRRDINLPTYEGSLEYIFTAKAATHWIWFKNSWVKNLLKSKNMSFKVRSVESNVENLSISDGKVVSRSIKWDDENGNPVRATITVNKKPQ